MKYLRIRNLNVAPSSVDHVTLREDSHLRLVRRESDETETFRLSSFQVFFHLKKTKQSKNALLKKDLGIGNFFWEGFS